MMDLEVPSPTLHILLNGSYNGINWGRGGMGSGEGWMFCEDTAGKHDDGPDTKRSDNTGLTSFPDQARACAEQ